MDTQDVLALNSLGLDEMFGLEVSFGSMYLALRSGQRMDAIGS